MDEKDTVYRLMNDPHNNWRTFLLRFSTSVIEKIHRLTDPQTHLRTLILDDSTFYRNRSQKVPGLARLWDHALQKGYKGYRMLTLGFSDGYSFLPIDFSLLSGNKKSSPPSLYKTSEPWALVDSKKRSVPCLKWRLKWWHVPLIRAFMPRMCSWTSGLLVRK